MMHNTTDLVYNNCVDNNMAPNPKKTYHINKNGKESIINNKYHNFIF